MSTYTTQLRWVCQQLAGIDDQSNSIRNVISLAAPKIFNFAYPQYTAEYNYKLEVRFLHHFYFEELCCETYPLWHDRLDDTFNTIMPKYLPMIDLINQNFTANFTATGGGYQIIRDNTNTQTGNQTTKSGNTSKYSDTPQGAITGLLSDKYLTSATITDGDNTYEGSTTTSVHDDELRTDSLSTQDKINIISDYNQKIYTIDQLIFNDCETLFMGVW